MPESHPLPQSDLAGHERPVATRAGLIVAIDALYAGARENHWAEAERLARALGWSEFSMDLPDSAWVRARLDELLSRG